MSKYVDDRVLTVEEQRRHRCHLRSPWQGIVYYPPGRSLDCNGATCDNADIAKKLLANLRAGKSVAIPRDEFGDRQWTVTNLNAVGGTPETSPFKSAGSAPAWQRSMSNWAKRWVRGKKFKPWHSGPPLGPVDRATSNANSRP